MAADFDLSICSIRLCQPDGDFETPPEVQSSPRPPEKNVDLHDLLAKVQELYMDIDDLKDRVKVLENRPLDLQLYEAHNSQNLTQLPKRSSNDQLDGEQKQVVQTSSMNSHDMCPASEIMTSTRTSTIDDLIHAKTELERVQVVRFSESVWDACITIRLGMLKKRELILMVFCYLMTIGIQGFFIYATFQASTDYNEDLVNDIRMWRVKYGHDIDFASTDSERPLASIVCRESGRASEIAGGKQTDILEEMNRYRNDGGVALSVLAVCLWSFCCLKELLDLIFFQVGITAAAIATWKTLGPGACTGIFMNERRNFEITSLTWHRALSMCLFVTLPRLILLLVLGSSGIRFLMAIQDLEEIIMNAVALEVILHVDNMIFATMVPALVQGLVVGLEPMRVQKSKTVAKALPIARLLFVMAVVVITIVVYCLPLLRIMDQVEFEMCDGYVDFVTRQDLSKQYTLWVGDTSDKRESEVRLGEELSLFRHQGVLQATVLECQRQNQRMDDTTCRDRRVSLPRSATQFENAKDSFDVSAFYVNDPENVRVGIWRGQMWVNVRERAEEAYCYDFDSDPITSISEKISIRMAMQEQLRPQGLKPESCADVKHLCRKSAEWSSQLSLGNLVRLACPITCGCDSPAKGLLHAHEMYGCPSVCRFRYEQNLKELPCADRPDDAASLAEYQASYEELFDYDEIIHKSKAEGIPIPISCNSWAESTNILHTRNWSIGPVSACDAASASILWEYGLRSIRPQCPVTCGCLANPESPECPGSCVNHKLHSTEQ